MIEKLKRQKPQWLKSARIGGSYSRNIEDEFSDIDIFITTNTQVDIAGKLVELAQLVGNHIVLTNDNSDKNWGTWISGYFNEYGYVDLCALPKESSGITHMTDISSVIFIDQNNELASSIYALEKRRKKMSHEPFDYVSLAWLKLFKAGKEVSRGGWLQFEKYLLEGIENSVRAIRIGTDIDPTGRNWDQPLRDLENQIPTAAEHCEQIYNSHYYFHNESKFFVSKMRLLLAAQLLKKSIEINIRNNSNLLLNFKDIDLKILDEKVNEMFLKYSGG